MLGVQHRPNAYEISIGETEFPWDRLPIHHLIDHCRSVISWPVIFQNNQD